MCQFMVHEGCPAGRGRVPDGFRKVVIRRKRHIAAVLSDKLKASHLVLSSKKRFGTFSTVLQSTSAQAKTTCSLQEPLSDCRYNTNS